MFMRIIFIAFACGLVAGCASFENVDGSYLKAFGESTTIPASYGNGDKDSELFVNAAREVLKNGWRIRIDVPCASACVVFADLARPNVCITSRAVFGFHKQTVTGTSTTINTLGGIPLSTHVSRVQSLEDLPLSPKLAEWVAGRGGFSAENDFNRVLKMYYPETASFWPMCK